MDNLILSALHFLHISGAVAWLGGILMILYVILPSARALPEPAATAGTLMKEVAQRFTPFANFGIVVLVSTGVAITCFRGTSFLEGQEWWLLLSSKTFLVACMILVHLYRGRILNPRITRLSAANPGDRRLDRWKEISLQLVKANLALGV